MDKRTCSTEGCDRTAVQYGDGSRCRAHHLEWRSTLTCKIPGCGKKPQTLQGMLCAMHYRRLRVSGDTGGVQSTRAKNDGACSVDGCNEMSEKTLMCGTHYRQMARFGEIRPLAYKRGAVIPCLVCGKMERSDIKSLKFCSSRCERRYYTHGNEDLPDRACVQCGALIELRPRDGDRWRNPLIRICDDCRREKYPSRRYAISLLAQRDGEDCSICSETIDLALRHPNQMSASVDHVIPVSHGGTHEPENLALAHLRCNRKKYHAAIAA